MHYTALSFNLYEERYIKYGKNTDFPIIFYQDMLFYIKSTKEERRYKMLNANLGELAALGTAFSWSLSAIFFELSGKKIGSLAVNYIRLIFGFIYLCIFLYFVRGMAFPTDASVYNWTILSISGLIGLFIGDLFLFQSYLEVGSRISTLIMATSPPLSAILGYLIFGEKLGLKSILGMVITLMGIGIVILGKKPNEKLKVSYSPKGLLYAFIGATGQSVGLIFSKLGMGAYDPFAATQIRIIAGFISFTLLILYRQKFTEVFSSLKEKKAILHVAIGAIFGPFVGVGLSLLSLQNTSAGISATITAIVPVTIIPMYLIAFKEKIKFREIVGAFITVIGVGILFI